MKYLWDLKNLEDKNTYKIIEKERFVNEIAANWNNEKFLQKVDYYLASSCDWVRYNETYTVKKTYYGTLAEIICENYLKAHNIPFEKDLENDFIIFGPDGGVDKPANLQNRSDIKIEGVNAEIKHLNVGIFDYDDASRKAQQKALKEKAEILMLINFRTMTMTIWRYWKEKNKWYRKDDEHDIEITSYSNIC